MMVPNFKSDFRKTVDVNEKYDGDARKKTSKL